MPGEWISNNIIDPSPLSLNALRRTYEYLMQTSQQPAHVFINFMEPFSVEATEQRWKQRSKTVPRQRSVSASAIGLNYYGASFLPRNRRFAEEHDFGLADHYRLLRRRAPLLLSNLLGDSNGGMPAHQLPLPLAAAIMQQDMDTQAGQRLSYSEMREISHSYKLGTKRIGWGYAETDPRALATLESHSWNDMQLHVEARSIYRNINNSAFYWYYPQLEMVSRIVRSIHVDLTNPGVVMWYEIDPSIERYDTAKKYSARWGKFLKMLRRKFGFRFTDAEIEEVATWVGDNLKSPVYTFQQVNGDEIVRTYREQYFGSCMHESSAIHFYTDQENVRMLRIKDESNHLVGRALIWEAHDSDGEPVTILDRIYPSDGGPHIRAAQRYAAEAGWVYKLEQAIDGPLSRDGVFQVTVTNCGYFPYMDTFAYAKTKPKKGDKSFLLSNDRDYYISEPWHSTGNYNPWTGEDEEELISCDNCGEEYPEDDLQRDPHNHDLLCNACFEDLYVWSDSEMAYLPREDTVEVENVSARYSSFVPEDANYVVYSEPDGVYYTTRVEGDLRPNDAAVRLTGGEWEGEWTVISNVATLMDLIIHTNDPKYGFYETAEQERQPLL